jgi:tripartite-type tricarboxylate transporter receptor subunit TctC
VLAHGRPHRQQCPLCAGHGQAGGEPDAGHHGPAERDRSAFGLHHLCHAHNKEVRHRDRPTRHARGGGGQAGIAAEHVAKANPDGYTILYGSNGPFGSFKSLYKKLPFDPVTIVHLHPRFGSSPLILVVPASSPFKTLKDLVDYAKANPDKLTFGSVGSGSAAHLVAELLGASAGIRLTSCAPTRGPAPAMIDLLGGRINFIFDYSIVVKPQIEAGKLRALASTGAGPADQPSGRATAAELGYPGVQLTAWGPHRRSGRHAAAGRGQDGEGFSMKR